MTTSRVGEVMFIPCWTEWPWGEDFPRGRAWKLDLRMETDLWVENRKGCPLQPAGVMQKGIERFLNGTSAKPKNGSIYPPASLQAGGLGLCEFTEVLPARAFWGRLQTGFIVLKQTARALGTRGLRNRQAHLPGSLPSPPPPPPPSSSPSSSSLSFTFKLWNVYCWTIDLLLVRAAGVIYGVRVPSGHSTILSIALWWGADYHAFQKRWNSLWFRGRAYGRGLSVLG